MCQVKYIDEMGSQLPLRLKLEQALVDTLFTLKIPTLRRKLRMTMGNRIGNTVHENKPQSATQTPPAALHTGDRVRVRSQAEIMQTLDSTERMGGCAFMKEMWQYCDGEYTVAKKIDYFFDEARFKMQKSRDLVLLEGLYCSGNIPIFSHRCDRHCLFFWKEAWLEKISDGDAVSA